MTLELVKEINKLGEVSYHIEVDGRYESGTARTQLVDVMEVYDALKTSYSFARKEVLIKEQL
jgi:uncharacterized protein YfbU (UPF0304 family)